MKILDLVLGEMIRRGRVAVEIPGIEHIEAAVREESFRRLWEIEQVVLCDEMGDGEKIARVRALLDQEK